jgi:1,4-alpha-glucan branching enzyme
MRPRTRAPSDRFSLLTEEDLFLFNQGTHYRLYNKLGAHPVRVHGEAGTYFALWAPNAESVSVIGDFNDWSPGRNPLSPRASSGIWEGFHRDIGPGALYKFRIRSRVQSYTVDKADPFAFSAEVPPRTASRVTELSFDWHDGPWMEHRAEANALSSPISIYELHLGSWRRVPEERNRPLTYREMAPRLADYLVDMGFTHVEFLPVMEHPFYGSWGYQTTGYFAPTSRYGSPSDFMALVDHLHQRGLGVLLDWVPSHFPTDSHGLAFFDGTHLYEHEDPRQGVHPDWNSYIFNYGRNEVPSFLLSSALFWLDVYHADGLRVDAVASMLYRDFSRKPGEWIPNERGGRENLEAIAFLRRLNEIAYGDRRPILMVAEESTAWPMVSRPTYLGGLGFGLKWDMGWMHDTLDYLARDPVHRRFHHHELTFRSLYAFHENFLLPLSHDEVVYGKGSLLGKMPGDDWQRFANVRLLLGYQFSQPGKKLLFMGDEFADDREWSHEASLDWHLLDDPRHRGIARWVRDLNRLYREEPALHRQEFEATGFRWVFGNDDAQSVYAYLRIAPSSGSTVLAVGNFTPVPRHGYRVGVSSDGSWRERLNSDAGSYGGSGLGNLGKVASDPVPSHGQPFSLSLTLPPLAWLFLTPEGES